MSTATNVKDAIARTLSGNPKKWRWYHGLAFYVIVQLLTFGLSGLTSLASGNKNETLRNRIFGDVSYFRTLRQSIFTPPSWVFGLAWPINNFFTIWGDLHVLNKPEGTPGRDEYLALQGTTWLNYILFNAAYFSLRSPINAFVLTLTFFCLTVVSGFVALFRLKDTKVALSLATLFIWLLVALTAATFQVLWNRDEFYHVGPFTQPIPSLVTHRD